MPRPLNTRRHTGPKPHTLGLLTPPGLALSPLGKGKPPMPPVPRAAQGRRREPRLVPVPPRAAPLLARRRGRQPLNADAADPLKRKNAGDPNNKYVSRATAMSCACREPFPPGGRLVVLAGNKSYLLTAEGLYAI
jgi:hypothetical protein